MIQAIGEFFNRIITWTAVGFFAAGTLLYTFQILFRFVFQNSFFWIDSLISYLFTLAALMGAALAVRNNENIKIDIFRKFGEKPGVRLLTEGFALIVSSALFLIFLQHALVLYRDGGRSQFGVPNWVLNLPYLILFSGSWFYYLSHCQQSVKTLKEEGEVTHL